MKGLMIMLSLVVGFSAQAQTAKDVHAKMVILLKTETLTPEHEKVASAVLKYSRIYQIDYNIVLAVLMQESTLTQGKVSRTGDLGIGQINPKSWGAEFVRLKRKPLDVKRLHTDAEYAISRTVEILSIVKKSDDKYWIGRYHSKTPSLKKAYYALIMGHHAKIKKNPMPTTTSVQLASN